MDCDSGDEGNNEVKCVKSDESDKYRVGQKSKPRTQCTMEVAMVLAVL